MSNYIKELPQNAKQVKNALTWVTPEGQVFGKETRVVPNKWTKEKIHHKHYGEHFQYQLIVNKHNGYVYVPIKYIIECGRYELRQRRLHIIVAETFLSNPFNLPIVGHKNNIKTDCRVNNLYWTTYKENTQKACDDGLLLNDKGYEDSQSFPVVMFSTYTNQEIGRYGSASEAERETKIPINTILRQCKYKKPVRKDFYFRFQSDETITPPPIVVQYDYYTDKVIGVFYNISDAANKTGTNYKTINYQCNKNQKPKILTKTRTYFLYKNS